MHTFRFRLQSLMNLRRFEEQEVALELAQVNSRYAQMNKNIAHHTQEIEHTFNWQVAPENIDLRISRENWITHLHQQRRQLQQQLANHDSQRQKVIARYQEAVRRRMILERLRERQWQSYCHYHAQEYDRDLQDNTAISRREIL